jgi:outer membrane protein assembly factor BamB
MTHLSRSNFGQHTCASVACPRSGPNRAPKNDLRWHPLAAAVAAWRVLLAASLLTMLVAAPALAQQLEWSRSFHDEAQSVGIGATWAHGAFVYQVGSIGEYPETNAYVRKHDLQGRVIWTRRLPFEDRSWALEAAVDHMGAYVFGYAEDSTGRQRYWLARIDAQTGNIVWVKQLGESFLNTIAVHAGGIYVGGYDSGGALLLKLDRNGNRLWSKPLGAGNEIVQIIVFNDSLYVRRADVLGIRRLDLQGAELSRFPAPDGGSIDAMGVDASGVYALVRGYQAYKYTHDGRLQWRRRLLTEQGYLSTLALDATGIYAGGTGPIFSLEDKCCKVGKAVMKLAPSGHVLWSYKSEQPEQESSALGVAVRDSVVYLTSYETLASGAQSTSFNRLTQDMPPQAQSMSDLDGDDIPELAVLSHDSRSASVSAVIKSAGSGRRVRRISFDSSYWPRQLLRLPDLNGNGTEELAVLGVHRTSGATSVEVRDGRTGLLVSRVPFAADATPHQLVWLPDASASGASDLALLAWSNDANAAIPPPFVEVRDGLTGTVTQTLRSAGEFIMPHLLVLPDRNGNGSPELALAQRFCCMVEIFDARSGQRLPEVTDAYDDRWGAYEKTGFATLPDGNANGVSEMVVLRQLRGGNQTISLRVFDGASPPRNVPFGPGGIAREMLRLPDIDGNRYPEIAVLKTDTRPGRNVIQVKDGRSGALIGNHAHVSEGYTHRGLSVLSDVNGNGSPEIVVLQQRTSDRKTFALIKDARTGAYLRSIAY